MFVFLPTTAFQYNLLTRTQARISVTTFSSLMMSHLKYTLSIIGASVGLFVLLFAGFSTRADNDSDSLSSDVASKTVLVMIEEDFCPYCRKFDHEIGPIYPKTEFAKIAPLLRISLDEKWPDAFSGIERGQITPQFLLISNGEEVNRLLGYNGDEFFWVLLEELFSELP